MLFHWACKSTKFELSKARRTVWAVQKPRSAGPAALTVAAVVAGAASWRRWRRRQWRRRPTSSATAAPPCAASGRRCRQRRWRRRLTSSSEHAAQAPRHRVYTTMRVRSQSQSTTRSLIWTHPSKKWTRPVTVPRHLGQETGNPGLSTIVKVVVCTPSSGE